MKSLEPPLEAPALNYFSHGLLTAVNSVWTWIAVLTAAVSFWKIKASPTPPPPVVLTPGPRCRSQDGASTSSPPLKVTAARETKTHLLSGSTLTEREGSTITKMKFSFYYDEEDEFREGDGSDENSDDGGDDGGVAAMSEKLGWWCEDRERMWDMGWYRCQDLRVLDGSVVRLWDGRR